MLSTLRERRETHQQTENLDHEEIKRALVLKLDAGEQLTEEEIEQHVSMLPDPTPICPKHADHKAEVIGTSRRAGVEQQRCRCTVCDATWLRDEPKIEPVPGKWSIEELEAGVKLLRERRQWAADLAERPKLVKQRNGLQRQVDEINKKLVELMEEKKTLTLQGDDIRHQIARADNAESRLRQTGTITLAEKKLIAQRGNLSKRIQAIRTELWGQSQPGRFDVVESGTAGSRYVAGDREILRLEGSDGPKDRLRLDSLKSRKRTVYETEIKPLEAEWNRLREELATVEGQIAELQEAKLIP